TSSTATITSPRRPPPSPPSPYTTLFRSTHSQYLSSVTNAKTILKRYCDKLYISESFGEMSSKFYHELLIKKFMNGRRLNVVLARSEEHTSELQSRFDLVCRLLLENEEPD